MESQVSAKETMVNSGSLNKGKCWLSPVLLKTLNVETSYLKEGCWKRRFDGHRPRVPVKGGRVTPIPGQEKLGGLSSQVVRNAVGNTRQVYGQSKRKV